MRKVLLLVIVLFGMATVHAEDYFYLTIVETDGTKTSLTSVGLSLTFSSDELTVSNAYTDESKTIALSHLASLNFSNDDETNGIHSIQTDATFRIDEADAVYTLQGQKLPTSTPLQKGVYLIRKGTTTKKLQVR
ncbi:MAG: hypothetical protein IK075_00550 [Prevotella sp.]|nr:hypothetical protein [Prevotella sp.]